MIQLTEEEQAMHDEAASAAQRIREMEGSFSSYGTLFYENTFSYSL